MKYIIYIYMYINCCNKVNEISFIYYFDHVLIYIITGCDSIGSISGKDRQTVKHRSIV